MGLTDIFHWVGTLRSKAESAYYSESKLENAKREALAEKRKRQIKEVKNGNSHQQKNIV
jgi:hypothetical protein